jgi:hypothetical protein
MNSYCVNALLSLVLVLPVTLKTTEPALIALKIERRNWSGKIKPGERIEVDNEWGEVRVRFGGNKGQVEYLAVLQPLTLGTARVTVAAEPITGGLHIVTRVENGALPAGAKDRADLTIFVPKGSPLRVRTLRGLIDISGIKGDVNAETEAGEISIRTVEGLVKTINQHGTTTVLLERLADHTEQTFESLTGDITVSLPTTAEPMVTIGTSGDICSDVSIVIVHHPHEEPSKIATARVGAGVSSLLIRSKRGNIHLRQREDVRTGSTTVEHPTIDSDD